MGIDGRWERFIRRHLPLFIFVSIQRPLFIYCASLCIVAFPGVQTLRVHAYVHNLPTSFTLCLLSESLTALKTPAHPLFISSPHHFILPMTLLRILLRTASSLILALPLIDEACFQYGNLAIGGSLSSLGFMSYG